MYIWSSNQDFLSRLFSVLCVLSPSRCTHIHTLKIYIIFHKHVRFVLLINYQSNKCVILSFLRPQNPSSTFLLFGWEGRFHLIIFFTTVPSYREFISTIGALHPHLFHTFFPLYPHWMHFVQNIDALLHLRHCVCVCVMHNTYRTLL